MTNPHKEIRLLNQSDLQPRAKSLYLALMEIADSSTKCTAILASLVFKSGMSESTVIRATKELEAAGFISTTRFAKIGPNTPPNIYSLIHRTAQSCQIDSTCPVNSTGKNTITNKEDSTTNNACHHDTRGAAPSVMDDRLEDINIILNSVLEKHQPYFFDEEIIPMAREVVSMIGLDELESRLQEIKDHHYSLNKLPSPIQDSLKNILEELHRSSDTSVPKI